MTAISVVLTVHNKAHYIEDMLIAVRRQAPDCELVCVDDGSTDGTGPILKRHADVFLHTEDIWEVRANNAAIAAASGDVMMILQDDDMPFCMHWPVRLQQVMDGLGLDILSARGTGLWHAFLPVADEVTQAIEGPDFVTTLKLAPVARLFAGLDCPAPPASAGLVRIVGEMTSVCRNGMDMPVFASEVAVRSPLCIHRRVIDAIGPFNEAYAPLFGDDYDFCHRARAAGFRIGFTQMPLQIMFRGGSRELYTTPGKKAVFAAAQRANFTRFYHDWAASCPRYDTLDFGIVRLGSWKPEIDGAALVVARGTGAAGG